MRRLSQFKLVGTLLGAAACTNPTAPLTSTALRLEQPLPTPGSSALRVASVTYHGELPLVDAPSTAVAGQPFEVAVTTYGGGCIGEDTTVVDVSGHGADIVPYQRIHQPPQGRFSSDLSPSFLV